MASLLPWLQEPDWTSGVSEGLAWLTQVLQSPTGAEQRIALRLSPRRTFEASVMAQGADRQALENLLFHAGASRWALPIWTDVMALGMTIPAGEIVIPLNVAGRDFIVGETVLFKDGLGPLARHELAIVSKITATAFIVTRPLAMTWPAGTCIYPTRPAELTDPPQITRHNDSLIRAQVRFRIVAHNAFVPVFSAPLYRGHAVLEHTPDHSTDLTVEYQRRLLELDNSRGIPKRTDTARRPFVVQQHVWSEMGRDAQINLRALFYYLRGCQRAIWVASQARDFSPLSGMSGRTLDVSLAGFSDYGIAPGRRDIRILLTDGTCIYRRIVAAAPGINSERLTLDGDALIIDLAQIVSISFMTLCRQNADAVTWEHVTDADGFARVSTLFRGLRDELE